MNRSKKAAWIAGGCAAVLIAVLAIGARMEHTVGVSASPVALSGEPWQVVFGEPLDGRAGKNGNLRITGESGIPVDADMTIEGNRLGVAGLKEGTYTLHVKRSAFAGLFGGKPAVKSVKFNVRDVIEPVASLAELEDHFRRISASREKQGLFGMTIESSSSEDKAAESSGGGMDGHSETNTQVEGVDEGDIVKTDGEYLYAATGGEGVRITDIRNPEKPVQIAELPGSQEFMPMELYLDGDTLAVIGHRYFDLPIPKSFEGGEKSAGSIMPAGGTAVTVRLYDVGNPAKPKLLQEAGSEGWYLSSRLTNGILYIVTNVQQMGWAIEEGRDVRPFTYDTGKERSLSPMETGDITILPGTDGDAYSVITSISLEGDKAGSVKTKAYLGSGSGLYMSKEHLYITSSTFGPWLMRGDGTDLSSTSIFKFGLDGTDVRFLASGEVSGRPLNQFSMDEHKGYFRIAVTEGDMWDEQRPSESAIHVFDAKMKETGSVGGLARGERIYSARFMGDRGYVVTFRETDPLFALDLSDPAAPKVLGELKIPGFSNYLHPLGKDHLIGFGEHTIVTGGTDGKEPVVRTAGMKISLFDVSDMANPKEQATEIIGGSGTHSDIQYDHKVLFEHKGRNLYGFPVMIYEEKGKEGELSYEGGGALIYEITPEGGIVKKGDLTEKSYNDMGYEDYDSIIQRIVWSGNAAFAVTAKDVTAYSLDGFDELGSTGK
ncbi:beta-propeller domain-containing protein [Edaphobacillus lindanitolerans]|uniref:Secreted protein containing C-terminal beta-propeller domain n=1 Tax=Edaphobacillus lindanitolerans TaxID=550447 RepID=A0A1U7PJI7_9BACI|nr:beta-propeller domain-containing protein [Edaphobacillus lindanitolerans]SIT70483.1 Secreted protein containing C-terminal beta-propeller domain [Edaphobacillus lindanitolerans]